MIAFLNVKTRRVILSPATLHPNEAWVVAQAESFVKQARAKKLPVSQVQRDRETKFTMSFDVALKRNRVKPVANAYRSPNTDAYVERFIQSIQQECLDRFAEMLSVRPLNELRSFWSLRNQFLEVASNARARL